MEPVWWIPALAWSLRQIRRWITLLETSEDHEVRHRGAQIREDIGDLWFDALSFDPIVEPESEAEVDSLASGPSQSQ